MAISAKDVVQTISNNDARTIRALEAQVDSDLQSRGWEHPIFIGLPPVRIVKKLVSMYESVGWRVTVNQPVTSHDEYSLLFRPIRPIT